jgi:hypothetical protein
MTYVDHKAHEAQDRWLNGAGGHAEALESVKKTIAEVIRDCADQADNPQPDWFGKGPAARIRQLLTKTI